MSRSFWASIVLAGCALGTSTTASQVSAQHVGRSDEHANPTSLPFGLSAALEGPTSHLGRRVVRGVTAAFDEYNARPENASRKLTLLPLDDGFEPRRTAPNMRTFAGNPSVLAVLGNVGAPCAVAAVPVANELHLPLLGCVTGGSVLRKSPPDRYVINFRASLAEEAAELVRGFVEHHGLRPEEIGFFTQRDALGDSAFAGGLHALRRQGMQSGHVVPHARYERNTSGVETGLSELILAEPPVKAVIVAGACDPAGEIVRGAKAAGFNPQFAAVAFVEASRLADKIGSDADGMIVSQVVPFIYGDAPIAREHRRALAASFPDKEPSFVSLESYVAARILIRALDDLPPRPTREQLVDALLSLGEFDLGLGAPLRLSVDEHQACHKVWITVVRNGDVLPYEWPAKTVVPRDQER